MLKKYLHDMHGKPPHERRQAAMRIAASITAVIFVGWVATLGVRLGGTGVKTAQDVNSFQSQVASVISAFSLPGSARTNTLEVSTTTNY